MSSILGFLKYFGSLHVWVVVIHYYYSRSFYFSDFICDFFKVIVLMIGFIKCDIKPFLILSEANKHNLLSMLSNTSFILMSFTNRRITIRYIKVLRDFKMNLKHSFFFFLKSSIFLYRIQ